MRREHRRKKFGKLSAVAASSIGLGLVATPGTSFAVEEGLCPGNWIQLPGSNVCEWTFLEQPNEQGEWVVSIPEGASKIGAILIGNPVWVSGGTYAGGAVGYYEQTLSASETTFTLSFSENVDVINGDDIFFQVGDGEVFTVSGYNLGEPKTVSGWTGQTLDADLWGPLGYDWAFEFYSNLPQGDTLTADWSQQLTSGVLTSEQYQTIIDNYTNPGADEGLTHKLPLASSFTTEGFWGWWVTPGVPVIRVLMGPTEPPAPASAQYNGPIALMVQRTGLPAGTRATATAERMTGITRVLVDGVSVDFKIESDSKITFLVPSNLKPGTYPVHFEVGPNTTLTDKVTVSRVAASASTYQANRLFANYQGDNQSVAPADAAAILSFVSKYKNVTSVTCIGSTSGIPAEPTDQALALSRAKNACDLIQKQVPGATITLKTSVGKGVGQKFRSVQVFLQGTN